MRRLARLGAMKRLEELQREESSIRAAFPELFRGGSRPVSASAGATRVRKAYKMSAEAKRAVSERMKKYWAERRKAKR